MSHGCWNNQSFVLGMSKGAIVLEWNKKMLSNKRIRINLNFQTVSFGTNRNNENQMIVNFIMVTAKYFIVKCKYTEVTPEVMHYKNVLKNRTHRKTSCSKQGKTSSSWKPMEQNTITI